MPRVDSHSDTTVLAQMAVNTVNKATDTLIWFPDIYFFKFLKKQPTNDKTHSFRLLVNFS